MRSLRQDRRVCYSRPTARLCGCENCRSKSWPTIKNKVIIQRRAIGISSMFSTRGHATMNLSEFKAWFEGFTESMDGPPGEKAWKRIQDRIKSIKSDEPTTQRVFHEYYEKPWKRWYGAAYKKDNDLEPLGRRHRLDLSQAIQKSGTTQQGMADNAVLPDDFDSCAAFTRLGLAEALSLKAR